MNNFLDLCADGANEIRRSPQLRNDCGNFLNLCADGANGIRRSSQLRNDCRNFLNLCADGANEIRRSPQLRNDCRRFPGAERSDFDFLILRRCLRLRLKTPNIRRYLHKLRTIKEPASIIHGTGFSCFQGCFTTFQGCFTIYQGCFTAYQRGFHNSSMLFYNPLPTCFFLLHYGQ